ncbi:glycine--tRNA ligase subunit beta [Spongiibacter sp.]|uniref:glycine--tRNA ligase subunit beta n=1 Tax=Spongiibacter sp. TaxID=2024860 RepID=UPI00356A9F1A
MSKRDLLIEIGTEELPPKALKALSEAFTNSVVEQLRGEQLSFDAVRSYATPRRLAMVISALDEQAPDKDIEKWGPPLKVAFKDGQATKAAEAFAKGNGLALDELSNYVANDGKQDKLCYRSTVAGSRADQLLANMVEQALAALPIPKRMRWGAKREQFVRPVHWVSLLFGDQVIAGEIMGHTIGRSSRGHRFHSSGEISLAKPAQYAEQLESEGRVIADFSRRRDIVRSQVEAEGQRLGGAAVIDDDLLDEVTALVEWPVALAGNFEQRFLKVPAEALISSMKEHQKYFHVVDSNGMLMPHFITVSNIESRDPQKVIDGNERVIRPRLSDAAFFFETDCKTTLAARRERLKKIVFQEKLGTVFDKTSRVATLATAIAEQLGYDSAQARRAAELCKSDLVSEMVLEFDDMQGIAGYYYALNDGESEDVALAMQEQYLPRFAGDTLPSGKAGTAVALADRLDTISGIFGIGQLPSGSKDPFALRRASLAVMRIIIEKGLDLDLRPSLASALSQHTAVDYSDELLDSILNYMFERLRAWYDDQGIASEIFLAVNAKNISQPRDFDQRVKAVQAFSQLPEASTLAAANKRVSNILAKADGEVSDRVDEALLKEAAEQALHQALQGESARVMAMYAAGDYSQGLKSLAVLRTPVDRFFDDVMVNVDDDALKNNRLSLLKQLQSLFLEVADISLLVPAKK